jgi:hypothetical protein
MAKMKTKAKGVAPAKPVVSEPKDEMDMTAGGPFPGQAEGGSPTPGVPEGGDPALPEHIEALKRSQENVIPQRKGTGVDRPHMDERVEVDFGIHIEGRTVEHDLRMLAEVRVGLEALLKARGFHVKRAEWTQGEHTA